MDRPNPDNILKMVKDEDSHRGKIKIFFGAVAGVGKTYAMLESARLRKKEGIDIVVGHIETHKRVDTESLLEGLEILPSMIIKYKNVTLHEFDIDAAIKRNPKIILVDELAHTNAPGLRHTKRWQDIEELLEKGINVYTTLNVQHCESVNDIVSQITGITVRETVPDTFIERSNDIELVDLPSEELLKRLKEGKIYLGEQKEHAAENFFQPGNLIALRQLALRYTAHNVDSKLQAYKEAHSIKKIWNVSDKFLVCISSSPTAIRLIRAGKRIASNLKVDWIVAYVEIPAFLKEEDKKRISDMMRLAETLGAETATLSGQDVAETLISYARSKNITKIIIGKPLRPRWKEFFFGSVIDNFARKSDEIDLYLLSGDRQHDEIIKSTSMKISPFSWKNFGFTIGIIFLCTIINKLLLSSLALVNLILIYFSGVTCVAFRYGRRMSIIASFLSVLFFDFFFVPPYFSFAVTDVEYFITFIVMLIVGFTIAHLTGQLKRQTIAMRLREDRTQALYSISRDLSKSSYPDELFKIALNHIQNFFKCRAVIYIPDINNNLTANFGEIKELNLSANDYTVVEWVYEHKKNAGKNTDTLPGWSKGMYLPFTGVEKTVGVLGIFPEDDKFKDPDQLHMLEMFVNQTALAVEGAELARAAIDAKSNIENERFKNLLLTTFSYELQDPLTSISDVAAELSKPENINDESKRNMLIKKMQYEINILNKNVNELPNIIDTRNKPNL
ncbi:sensor histidine kinase KdpD [Candidatus Desantisbacteria bacterium]|nr:sensor histidine kinase KdpD [Candidatus Desantisbacteria bacterium]